MSANFETSPRHALQAEYERGFIDGMQEQMKRSVDRAVNAMAASAEAEKQVSYSGNGTAGRENTTAPTGFFFQMPKAEQEPDDLTIAYIDRKSTRLNSSHT